MTSRSFLGLSMVLLAMAGVACGGSVTTGSGASGGSGTAGKAGNGGSGATGGATGGAGGATGGAGGATGGTGGSLPTGDCNTNADCGGATCAELTPGGYKVCLGFPNEATMCMNPGGPPMDQCCTSADCKDGGKCYLSTSLPYCGGPAMAEYNMCVKDQCATAADCPAPAICAPAGAFGLPGKVCRTAYCTTNADCSAQPGGYCAPIDAPCCKVPAGLACVYPGGCRQDSDCANNGTKHCEIDPATKSGVCKDGPAPCPA